MKKMKDPANGLERMAFMKIPHVPETQLTSRHQLKSTGMERSLNVASMFPECCS
jgi:hypothetical protein